MPIVGTPNRPRGQRRVGRVAQALLDLVARGIEARREPCGELGEARRILGVGAAAPDVAQHLLAGVAARRRALGRACPEPGATARSG